MEPADREGFLVPTVVLLSGPSGEQVAAQLRYSRNKIMPAPRQSSETSTTEPTLEESRPIKKQLFMFAAVRYWGGESEP